MNDHDIKRRARVLQDGLVDLLGAPLFAVPEMIKSGMDAIGREEQRNSIRSQQGIPTTYKSPIDLFLQGATQGASDYCSRVRDNVLYGLTGRGKYLNL